MKMLSSEAARAEAEEGSRVLRALADWPSGDIVVSHTNVANLPFARNWWRHLEVVGVHNFALLATDDDAYVRLRRELQAHAVRCPRSIVDGRSTPGPSRYRSAGWTRLMFAVPLMVRWVLRLGLNVLWMDTDVVALANPFPVIRAQLGQRARMGGGADGGADDDGGGRGLILASVDGRFPEEEVSECRRAYSPSTRWGGSAGGWKLCGGLFYLRHGAGALAFLRDWERRLAAPGAGAKNQPHYNDALRSATASGMAVELLPCDRFPNGYRYASSAWRAAQAPHTRKPVLVHNNWIKGHEAKLARFREWGMWMDNRTARR